MFGSLAEVGKKSLPHATEDEIFKRVVISCLMLVISVC